MLSGRSPDSIELTQHRSADWGIWLRLSVIVLAGVLTYSNSLSGPFVFDDLYTVVNNHEIRDWRNLKGFLSAPLESPVAGRPVVDFSFAVNFAIGGLDVTSYHAVNIALHLLCALLVFGVVRRALDLPRRRGIGSPRSTEAAFATAMIWVLHPLNSEAVNYVTQRTESMMALFYLLTLYSSIRAVGEERQGVWEGVAILSCAVGMACKESMVTAPISVMLFDRVFVFQSLREALGARYRLYLGLASTWAILVPLVWSGPRALSAGFHAGVDVWTYLLNQAVMIVRYLRLSIWPADLVLNYGTPLPLTIADVAPQAFLVVGLLLLTLVLLWRKPALGFLGAWSFMTLAPTSSLVPIATEVGAERRMYLPLIAIVLMGVIGWFLLRGILARGVVRLPNVGRHVSASGVFVLFAICAALAGATTVRNREYASGLLLAQTVLDRWPTGVAHSMVGTELAALTRDAEAVSHLREAVVTYPRARFALGVGLLNVGNLEEGIAQLRAFADQYPWPPDVVYARRAIARTYSLQQRWAEAAEQYRLVLAVAPADVETRRFLADALAGQQAFDDAARHYQTYLKMRKDDSGAWTGLGIALARLERFDEAAGAFRRAVELKPQDAVLRYNLALGLLARGDASAALQEAQEIVSMRSQWAPGFGMLGRAYASLSRYEEAIAQFEHALRLDPTYGEARQDLERLQRARLVR